MSLMRRYMRAGGSAINAVLFTSRMRTHFDTGRTGTIATPMNKPDKKEAPRLIAENRKARYDYFIEERLEAGLVLEGWEVKSMRAGKAQIAEGYVYLKNGEAFLFGALVTPLNTTSTHVIADAKRTRKLLLSKAELTRLVGSVERKG